MSADRKRCQHIILKRGLIPHQCLRLANIATGGKFYCTAHAPSWEAEKLAPFLDNQRSDK